MLDCRIYEFDLIDMTPQVSATGTDKIIKILGEIPSCASVPSHMLATVEPVSIRPQPLWLVPCHLLFGLCLLDLPPGATSGRSISSLIRRLMAGHLNS
jgi:hypothetical protein